MEQPRGLRELAARHRHPERLPSILDDEAKLFETHSNPMCSVVEYDSPMGPQGQTPRVELFYED